MTLTQEENIKELIRIAKEIHQMQTPVKEFLDKVQVEPTPKVEVQFNGTGMNVVATGLESCDLRSLNDSVISGIVRKINEGKLVKGDKIRMELFIL